MNMCWERVSSSHDFIAVLSLFPRYGFPLTSSGCWNNKLDLFSVVFSFSFTGLLRMGYPTDILSLVSYGDMYIYMARCQPEHRTLSSWIMGLSDGTSTSPACNETFELVQWVLVGFELYKEQVFSS
ncbi:hypothetical protein YC2023_108118 [Brassica napus]